MMHMNTWVQGNPTGLDCIIDCLSTHFETIPEATERAQTAPSKIKERSHVPTTDYIIGDLDQQLIIIKLIINL